MPVAAASKSASGRSTSSSSSSLKETNKGSYPISAPKKKPSSPNKPNPPRRSRSVSAISRRSHVEEETSTSTSTSSSSSDFLIKRDNPLYWSNVSPPDNENQESLPAKTKPLDAADNNNNNRRGRSVSRNADVGKNVSKEIGGRSLSRVNTGRCRSVSRGPLGRTHFLNSESDVEQTSTSLSKYRNRNDLGRGLNVGRKSNLVKSSYDTIEGIESLQTPISSSSENLASSRNLSWDDRVFASSLEAEERIGGEICEQMKAMRRSNVTGIANTNVTDIPPDLVNPSAVELVLDIRREYAKKLEQSQERARKLRADLAIEEHRGLELNRILNEVLPDPKMSNVQKSRSARKSSIERRKMSKRLTEEAMAYFDECVSLSTFDSSDFSSQEDPPISVVGISASVTDRASLLQASTTVAANKSGCSNDRQAWGSTCSQDMSGQSAIISSKEPNPDEISLNSLETRCDRRLQFSFAQIQNDTLEFQHDIGNFVKNFERDVEKVNFNSHILRSNCGDLDDYNMQASAQSLLFDTVLLKNKIESGTMLLCDGGVTVRLSPFGSLA